MFDEKIKQPKDFPEKVHAIIEIPRGSENKYEVDKESGLLKLDRPLFSCVHFPGDYGYIPNTLWEDGDPVDILVLTGHPVYPLTLAKVKVLGVLDMNDAGENDTKIIGVYDSDPRFKEYEDIKDIGKHKLLEIINFFETYKHLQGKEVKINSTSDRKEAIKAILKGKRLFEEKNKVK